MVLTTPPMGEARGGAAAIVSADSSTRSASRPGWTVPGRALLTRPTKVLYRVAMDSTA